MKKLSSAVFRSLLCVSLALVLPAASAMHVAADSANPRTAASEAPKDRVCQELRQRIFSEIASERAVCQNRIESFEECRENRRDLEGVEVFTCGFGVLAGVATGQFERPLGGEECGANKAENPRQECSVPACEGELAELEQNVLSRHGLMALPSC